MTLRAASAEGVGRPVAADRRPPEMPTDRFRSPSPATCDCALRSALPPGERWMVAAYGE